MSEDSTRALVTVVPWLMIESRTMLLKRLGVIRVGGKVV